MRKSNQIGLHQNKPNHRSGLNIRRIALTSLAAAALMGGAGLTARADTPSASADSFDSVAAALNRSDLKAALISARKNADDNPSDAVAQQVRGVLEIANGDPKAAQEAFDNAVQQGDALDPTPTGLEKFDWNGSALHTALNRQKVSIALDAGGASAYNNRAAMEIIRGHIEDAMSDLDEARRRRKNWPVPDANGAVAWLQSNSPRKAKQIANRALSYGGSSAKVYTILAVAQMRQQLWKDADQSFKRAEDYDKDFPYELYERSIWYDSQGDVRDEQRALFQAMAIDPAISDEDQYQSLNKYDAGGGSQQTDHEHSFELGHFSSSAFQTDNERDRSLVEDRSNSYQRRDYSQTMLGFGHGDKQTGLYINFLNDNGGRPGGLDQFVIPDATYGYRHANLSLFQNFELGAGRKFMLETSWRHSGIDEQSSPTALVFHPLSDYQLGLEGRYEAPIFKKSNLSFGYSWMQTSRRIGLPPAGDPLAGPTYTSPVEPNDQILQDGKSNLSTVYALTQQPASKKVDTSYGPVAAANGHSVFVLPYVNVHMASSPHVSYRLAALPRIMNANADLLPVWTLSSPIAGSEETQNESGTADYDQYPFIPGADGRVISLELSQSQLLRNTSYLTTTIFHRVFNDIDFLSQDPNVSPTLLLTHVPYGTTTGVTIDYTQPLPGGLNIQLEGTLQGSKGTLPLPGAPPINTLPEVPTTNVLGGVGYEQGTWEVTVHTIHIGSRTSVEQSPLPTGIGAICGLCNYQVTTVAPMTIVNVTVTHHLPNGQDIVFIMEPLNSAGYYVNYPKKPFFSVGYNYRY